MDSLNPKEIFDGILSSSEAKAATPGDQLLLRGVLGGLVIAAATAVAQAVVVQGASPFVGALLFPVGFAIMSLLGWELVTGNFGLLPAAALSGRIAPAAVARVWLWVLVGNFVGAVAFAFAFSLVAAGQGPLSAALVATAERKVLPYLDMPASGFGIAFLKGVICNWLVTTASVLSLSSRSTLGRIAALWLPVFTFFSLALEHSVVNMYAIPAGILLGAKVSWSDWWSVNLGPVILGNLAGALAGTAFPQWWLHDGRQRALRSGSFSLKSLFSSR